MKTIVTFILAIGLVMSTYAGDAPASIRKVAENKIQLLYDIKPAGTITVKIYDENNFLVLRDRIVAEKAFTKNYNFSKLAPAKYTVEVTDSKGGVENLEIDLVHNETTPVIYSKVEKSDEGKYKLLVNSLLATDMSILIFENDKLIHEETVSDANGFQKLYDLKGISPRSKVEFMVKTDDGFNKLMAVK